MKAFPRYALPLSLALAFVPALHAAQPAAQLIDQPDQGGTSSTVKDTLFEGTEKFSKGASEVTEISQDDNDLNRVAGQSAKRARSMVLNVVRTYSYDKPGMYDIKDVEEIRNRLNTGDWHCSVHTRDLKHGESTDVCSRSRNDGLIESAVITAEPKELTFIHTIKRANGEGSYHIMIAPPAPPSPPSPGASLGPGLSVFPGLNSLEYGNPGMAVLAAQAPLMEARAAEMSAMAPVMEARMAGMNARMEAMQALNAARLSGLQTPLVMSPNVLVFRSSHSSSSSSSSSTSSSATMQQTAPKP